MATEQTIEIPEGFELKKVSDTEYQIVKKEAELPDTWEEFCKMHRKGIIDEYFISATCAITQYIYSGSRDSFSDRNLLPKKEYAEAVLALCQLIQLRDCYRQEWKPDWTDASNKYCIAFNSDCSPVRVENVSLHNIFSFQSEEIRNKFHDNFKDLIETASYLWK